MTADETGRSNSDKIGFCQRLARKKHIDPKNFGASKLDRCLSTFDLTALGIGATLGVGIYVLSGSVAKDVAGPSIVLSFFIAGVASAVSGLCYAELGARVPKAGSAYVYSYTTVGEFVAFVIGWNLILEYAIGTASVARAYSGYLDSLMNKSMQTAFRYYLPMDVPFLSSYPDLCALTITLFLSVLLSVGVKESTRFNNVFTCLNLSLVVAVTVFGLFKADIHNWNLPKREIDEGGFFPFGVVGTLSGAATCFYGYVGFDAIATSGEEAKNPQKSIPLAIVLSLTCIFIAYFGVSSVLTLMVPYYLQDPDAPLPFAFHFVHWEFFGTMISFGALFGLSTSLVGALFPLPRVLYAMASDGLIFRSLANIHSKYQTPLRATVCSGLFVGLMTTLFDLKNLVDMMSIGTLMAYTIVSACVILLRYQDIPGLGSSQEYMPLDTIPDTQNITSNGAFTAGLDDSTDDEEIVYCRSEDIDDLNLSKPKGSPVNLNLFQSLLNSNQQPIPDEVSSALASHLTVIFSVLSAITAFLCSHANFSSVFVMLTFGLLTFLLITCLICLSLQPKTSQVLSFKVPLVPYLPGASIFINMYLMLKLPFETWIRLGVWMTIGFLIYFSYGLRESTEEYRMKGQKPRDG
eukprot:TCALIF_10532-PA protein Name:"Similar to Slc7a1 High affinity cationic amino acid transporter 1 (Mus musculus)" AED:0.05 eAED:0.05 QI:23/1/1/1/0.8/0.83/6/73/632